MKKILSIILLIFLSSLSMAPCYAFWFNKKIDSSAFQGKGYAGTLPDMTKMYKSTEPAESTPQFETTKQFNSENEIKPVPKDNPAFVNIILQPGKTTEYVTDMNDVVSMLENILTSIENQDDVQKFNAKVYFLDKSIEYLEDKYQSRPESQYISFKKVTETSDKCKTVANLRSQAEKNKEYIPYEGDGSMYSENNINQQIGYLKTEIEQTIALLREAE